VKTSKTLDVRLTRLRAVDYLVHALTADRSAQDEAGNDDDIRDTWASHPKFQARTGCRNREEETMAAAYRVHDVHVLNLMYLLAIQKCVNEDIVRACALYGLSATEAEQIKGLSIEAVHSLAGSLNECIATLRMSRPCSFRLPAPSDRPDAARQPL
jgi:hypothetical protein